MIKAVAKSDLPDCLEVFHRGYETVATEFGLTEENCPDRGRANLPMEKLIAEFENGVMMYGYFHKGKMVGFLGMKMPDCGVCKLNDVIILPEYRQKGYGTELLNFCKSTAAGLGALKIRLGMIDDNERLKKWYEAHGFVNTGTKRYPGASFTVGYMECAL